MKKYAYFILFFTVLLVSLNLCLNHIEHKTGITQHSNFITELTDYEPQNEFHYYLYDINHPKMKNKDGSIKGHNEFKREIYKLRNRNCNFSHYDQIRLVSPEDYEYYKMVQGLFRDEKGNIYNETQLIKNFEIALIEQGKIKAVDTIVAEKNTDYYYDLRRQFFDEYDKETFTINWGKIENEGTIDLNSLQSNVIHPIEVKDGMGNKLEIVQAKLGIYEWAQVCGQSTFDKQYAPILENGLFSKAATKKILNLNQAGESIIIQSIIVKYDGALKEIPQRFKFVVKKPQLAT